MSSAPLTQSDAQTFADRWYSAWNAGDLGEIMACYDEAVEHTSPFVAKFNAGVAGAPGTEGRVAGADVYVLRGKANVREYFGRALTKNPTPPGVTRFAPMHLTIGVASVLVVYRRMSGEIAGEIFFLNQAGRIVRSVSHYGVD